MITGIIIGFLCGAFIWFPAGCRFILMFRDLEPEIHNKTFRRLIERAIKPESKRPVETDSEIENYSTMDQIYGEF